VRTFDLLGLDRRGIVGVTMPGFGTTDRTYNNAMTLMRELGITIREINIADAVRQHFRDIGHDAAVHDVTYENSQARERTQILMDISNQVGGLVIGTGDLSELALGWCTYNGDHMSMYGVNVSIPKTLIRHLVRYVATTGHLSVTNSATAKAAANGDGGDRQDVITRVLLDIIDTPISPELTPADDNGEIAQKTEDLVGPYELHDFFLYYFLRFGFHPAKIMLLAKAAFGGKYADGVIKHWLHTFLYRFFAQQFKRSCLPDGPKVGSVSLSPRGDWRMSSDSVCSAWLSECDAIGK
jgi:NAD+ synthase (glutamine-hydrolysing)